MAEAVAVETEPETEIEQPELKLAAPEIAAEKELQKIFKRRETVAQLATQLARANAEKKAAQSAYDCAVDDLLRSVDDARQPELPFDEPPQELTEEEWRSVEVSTLNLTTTIVAALVEAELTTLGKLADFTSHNNLLTDIKGIGEAKAETIQSALDAFWTERRLKAESETETEATEEPAK